ncbi:uncharacterized protein LOC126844435 [Adelges cooleyi]|uniref:uncharacterized protein LOC126844435 n=1 Tax=Adelges cooleyi TaxID=133065 RepID=UPI00217FCC88|nr:uncharacterized protein LOC126844435 [Adelges cooleyi]
MRKIRAVYVLAVFLYFAWYPCCQSTPAECDFNESYDELVTVNVKEPVTIRKNEWCLKVPPRCPVDRLEYRMVPKNITVTKTKTIKRCCLDHTRLYNICVPRCNPDQCPNMLCSVDDDKCTCKPGYVGRSCQTRCESGTWGDRCRNLCENTCPDCDHQTGSCSFHLLLKKISEDANSAVAHLEPQDVLTVSLTTNQTDSTPIKSDTQIDLQNNATSTSTNPATNSTPTPETTATLTSFLEEHTSTKKPGGKSQGYYRDFVMTVTNAKATVYNSYDPDELMKKLIWISFITVAAIAMTFVVMLLVFFKCVASPSTTQVRQELAVPSDTKNESYNMSMMSNRYTKTPTPKHEVIKSAMHVPSETFCPVFKAPNYFPAAGNDVYDYPQPIYEVLC